MVVVTVAVTVEMMDDLRVDTMVEKMAFESVDGKVWLRDKY